MVRLHTLVSCALLVLATPCTAAALTPWHFDEVLRQWRPGIPDDHALQVPQPITHDERVEPVSLKDAIALALANNPGIAAQRLEPARQSEGILGAQAQYDPTLSGELLYSKSKTPNTSSLAGTRTLKVDDRSANFHLFKLFRTGTLATVDFLNDRLDNNARFNQLRPQYKAQLNFSLVQPLLRNFGWDFSYLVVRAAERLADAALYQYEAQLADFVEQVIEAYWNVVGARETLEVQRESMALADRTVEENEARVRVGLLPPVATLEARADAKAREEQVLIAENNLALARQQLAQIAYYRPDGTFVPRTLEPVEEAMPEDLPVDVDRTLTVALAERAEIQASARDVQAQQLNEKVAGNALLPRLDVIGSYGVNGVSGTNRPLTQQTIITSPTDLSQSEEFPRARCVPHPSGTGFLCTLPFSAPPSPFRGDANQAYDRFNEDFRTYSFGLQLQVPLSNALARSQHTQSRIALEQAELNHRELMSRVTLEVRQSVADVVTSRQRIDTSRVARELAEENLRNQEKRHEVGMATTKDLLDFQTRLTTARAAEVQAKIDHAIAVARWRRAKGGLLAYYQIVLEHAGKRSTPWFARF
jgi:HAE1 family hydrophobic/amphiphilic exporter-1